MKRPLHSALALVAAILHLGAPVASYAAMRSDARSADICSVAVPAVPASAGRSAPAPVSHDKHCAHAPCCAGGAIDAAAPAPVSQSVLVVSFRSESAPAVSAATAPVAPIAAAQPRGPPPQA